MIMKLRSKNFNLGIILRVNFVSEGGLDSFGSVQGPFADSRKRDNEPSVEEFEFEDNIRVTFVSESGLDSFGSEQGPFEDSRKHDNEPSVEEFEFEDNIRVNFV